MTQRWEYLTLAEEYSVSTAAVGGFGQWVKLWHIRRPGATTSEVVGGESHATEFLNQLGSEGWELVSNTVVETTIVPGQRGMAEVGTQVLQTWTFKRPVS